MNAVLAGFLGIVAMEYMGLGYQIPVLQKLMITTLLPVLMFIYVATKYGMSEVLGSRQVKILLAFILLTALAMLHGLVQRYAIDPLKQQIGYLLLLIIGFYALRTLTAIRIFILFFIAIHAYGVIQNADKFGQSERAGEFKSVGYFMGDGNDFAWSLSITIALAMFMVFTSKRLVTKVVVAGLSLLLLIGLVGTQSRGATLALSASMLYYMLLISKRRLLGVSIVLVVALGVWAFAPEGYFARMETISTYEEDTSATGRITAWGHAFHMALDHPLLGVGADSFNSAYGRYYRGEGDPQRWISTHSVYFKVLAEYGFTGIIIFLALLYSIFAENHRTARFLREYQGVKSIPESLPLYLNMALIAYAVAATFLSGLNYPHLYLITAMTLSVKWMAHNQVNVETVESTANTQGDESSLTAATLESIEQVDGKMVSGEQGKSDNRKG